MSCTLPPEILDLIIDHLHDEPATLKICCVVSKPWVPRARKHLFADIELHASQSHLELWKKTFPDPPNSPAHHTHTLSVCGAPALTAAEAEAGGWIRAFRNIKHLRLERLDLFPLTPFYGLSPAVRSLRLTHTTAGVLDLICSFPLLEDLALTLLSPKSSPDGWSTPSTSPKLTGYLELRTPGMVRSVTRRLSGLPGGLHFSKIKVVFFNDEVESVKDLVSRCSNTMESLTVICYPRNSSWTPPIDLSKAKSLKHLKFRAESPSVQWITKTLQTIESKILEHVTIDPPCNPPKTIEETIHQERQDLERMLVQFRASHSIRPQVIARNGEMDPGDREPGLLPELTRRGLADPVDFSH